MPDAQPTAAEWLAAFAADIGIDVPDEATITTLLDLAGVAAHSSERIAAPIACWMSAMAGIDPVDALARAKAL